MNKLLLISAVAFFSLAGLSYVRADDPAPEQCIGSMTELDQNLARFHGSRKDLSAEETMAIVSRKGPPPVEPPYTFGIAQDEAGETGVFIIYNNDCVKFITPPLPLDQINRFVGRVEANG